MTESTALIVKEKIDAMSVFQGDGMTVLVDNIEKIVDTLVPDVTTDKGRKEIASTAYKVAQSKTLLDSMGLEITSEWATKKKLVDGNRKIARDRLDTLKVKVRQPLTDWEAEDAERQEDARLAKQKIIDDRVSTLKGLDSDVSYMEIVSMSDDEYNAAHTKATEDYNIEKKRLAQEEIDRKVEAARQEEIRIANEAETKRLAVKKDKQDAIAKARQDALDEEHRIAEAKLADGRAALEKEKQDLADAKAATARAEQEKKDAAVNAEQKAKDDADAEARRVQAEWDAADAEAQDKIDRGVEQAKTLAMIEEMKPDAEKMRAYFDKIQEIVEPELSTELGFEGMRLFQGELSEQINAAMSMVGVDAMVDDDTDEDYSDI